MTIALAVDDRMGMMFDGRRLSRDRALSDRIAALAGGNLRIAPYSWDLFKLDAGVYIGEDYVSGASDDDICFVEDPADLAGASPEFMWLFRWNRAYPSDAKLPDGFLDQMTIVGTGDFVGTSHDKIRMEVWCRET